MNTGVLVPGFIAAGVVTTRAVLGEHRAPYPYELFSWAIVFGGIGVLTGGSDEAAKLGEVTAWGYLLAMVLAPSYADVLKLIPTVGASSTLVKQSSESPTAQPLQPGGQPQPNQ